jgi:acetyl CoA:N6-hydroxylysine acetyl transferase
MIITLQQRMSGTPEIIGAAAAPEDDVDFEIVADENGVVDVIANGDAAPPENIARQAISFVEALTTQDASIDVVRVRGSRHLIDALVQGAAAQPARGDAAAVELWPGLVWQLRQRWLTESDAPPYPELRAIHDGRGHPLRPPKPHGTLYRRWIPWLGSDLSFRVAVEDDVGLLHRWMNQPRVAEIWDEAGPIEHHRAYLGDLLVDPHILPLIGTLDGAPIGWFEVYYAAENRLGPHYPCEDWDRGWHVAIGEETCRGAAYVSAWLPSLLHFMFLDEPRTRRIVGEPRADHAQQLRNLERSGFATIASVDFPHKRAALVMLTRERFFRDHLWAPDGARRGAPHCR